MPASPLRGRFVWHELTTHDPDAAARFYPGLTGWKVEPYADNPSYRLWTVGGVPMGGLMALPDEQRRAGAPPAWLCYVGVPDVDATVRQATALGARVYVQPQTIPVGRFAVLADPQGAAFAVYRPSQEPMGGDDAPVGDFSWHELATTDPKKAQEFYRALFGWEHASSFEMGPGDTYWMFKRGGGTKTLGGIYRKRAEMAGPSAWLPYIRVASADKAAAAATRSGGKILNGPMDVPGGDRIAMCFDPQGAAFAVHTVVAQVSAKAKPKSQKPKKKPKKKPEKKPRAKAKPKRAKAKGRR